MFLCKLNKITAVYCCFGQDLWSSPVCFNPEVKLILLSYLFIPPVLHQRHAIVLLLLWLWRSYASLLWFCFVIQVVFGGNWRKIFAWHSIGYSMLFRKRGRDSPWTCILQVTPKDVICGEILSNILGMSEILWAYYET